MSINPFKRRRGSGKQEDAQERVIDHRDTAGSPRSPALASTALAYTASGNLEAHAVVMWLQSNGVQAHAVEDNSGASTFAFGTLGQFHKPQVFVDQADLERSGDLLRQFEARRDQRHQDLEDAEPITAECEECGQANEFPAAQNGTTQSCPSCHAFMDVGDFDWPDDFDFGVSEEEEEPFVLPDRPEAAIDWAAKLHSDGDWEQAILVYREAAQRWPEHATYLHNCSAEIEAKRDAAS